MHYRGVARNLKKGGSKSSNLSATGCLKKKSLGYGTAKMVNFGPFSIRFHVLQPVFFSLRTVLLNLTLDL